MGLLTRLLLAGLLLAGPATADPATDAAGTKNPKLDAEQVYELSQDAIGGQTGDHVLRDQSGAPLPLADLRGRPLVISLIFTSCGSVCPVTTDHLRDAVIAARKVLGDDSFAVLTFGFDASGDTPAQLTGFANTHRLANLDDWYLASADPAVTEALLTELGFSWREAAGGLDHVTQTTILDADGRVYRQLYGEEFPLPVFMQPLKDLVLGKTTQSIAPGDLWNRLTFLCTVYNPLTRAYRFDYGILFGIFFGALSLILTGLVIFRLWLERRRALRARGRAIGAGTGTK
jgi:protein SCO1/2